MAYLTQHPNVTAGKTIGKGTAEKTQHASDSVRYACKMLLPFVLLASCNFLTTGCGSGIRTAGFSSDTPSSPTTTGSISLAPVTLSGTPGSAFSWSASQQDGAPLTASCSWKSDDESVLAPGSGGTFEGISPGSANVSATCGGSVASATAVVAPAENPHIARITHGGIYTGNWSSNDPNTPAVSVLTDEAVTITNSTVTGKGTLIAAYGKSGANLTLTNVTGTGIDPGVNGLARGKFLDAEVMSSLKVSNCTITGTSFGIYVAGSTLSSLSITNNLASNLDDRLSDGNGGTLTQRALGHFIILNGDTLPNGGDIAWNQIIDAPGQASIEDIINIFQSHGADSKNLINIHDNYLEGAFAPMVGQNWYTGGGIQIDGGTSNPSQASGFILLSKNVVVRTANFGFSIGAGHDISVLNNRVVSCGQDGLGHWFNFGGSAYGMWNYYNTNQFYNNTISGNTGGLVVFANKVPTASDFYAPSISAGLKNTVSGNALDDPCFVDGVATQAAEATERLAWQARLEEQGQVLGDLHSK